MPTLPNDLDSLREAISAELGDTEKMAGDFEGSLRIWHNRVANEFITRGRDMNESIAEIATLNHLNNDQIDRLVQESNVKVFLLMYDRTKGQKVRRPNFPIADPTRVKDLMGTKTMANQTDSQVPGEQQERGGQEMTKAASFEDEILKGAFLTDTENHTPGLYDNFDSDKRHQEILDKRASEQIETEKQSITKLAREYMETLTTSSIALVKYARMGYDVQPIFDFMGKSVNLNDNEREVLANVYDIHAQKAIREGQLPKNFNTSLEKIASQEVDESEDFSLGKYASAKKSESTIDIPQIEADNQIVNAQKLVSLAKQIKAQHEELSKKTANQKKG